MYAKMTHIIQARWKHGKRESGVRCDRRISLRVNGESVQNDCKTSSDVRCRDMDI